ncbi:Cation Channel Sperm-Associated Protein Subunit Delta [Manis pentadactyla]|nr:Cation Channel Sperm-Associated Protein Subunit Delta [Manis pentadactyla]
MGSWDSNPQTNASSTEPGTRGRTENVGHGRRREGEVQREGVQRRRRRGGVGAGRRRRRGRGSAQAQEGTRFLEERLGGELALDVCLQVPNVPVLGAQREVHLALAPHHPGAVPCGQAGPGCGRDPSIKRPTMSTISLDIDDKEISCVDLKPLAPRPSSITVPSSGLPLVTPRPHVREVSACYKGILHIMALSDSYSYVTERDAYDPNFRGQKATKDQVVHYPYDRLGCPDLVYYDNPWKPVVEM